MSRILIVLPAFNEAKHLPGVVAGIRTSLPATEILVVDDGSADGTAEIARQLGTLVVSHSWNMGYGVTLQTGYKYALSHGYDWLVQIDADGQHDPRDIFTLLEPLTDGVCDFVLGSRFLGADSYRPPLARRIGMRLFSNLLRLLTGERITDSTSGFQAFNAEVLNFLTGDHFPCDYPDADLLLILSRAGFRITERPVRMFASSDGRSMHNGLKPFYYVFKMLLSIAVTLIRATPMRPGGNR